MKSKKPEEISNSKLGSDFETEFCELASKYGFWAHRMNKDARGQPADVIIVKNGKAALIDCKVCEGKKFPLSRIEDNQELAMSLWIKSGNEQALFAFRIGDQVRLLPFKFLCFQKYYRGIKELKTDYILCNGVAFESWMEVLDASKGQ